MKNISEILVLVIFQKIQIKQHVNADILWYISSKKAHLNFMNLTFTTANMHLKNLWSV